MPRESNNKRQRQVAPPALVAPLTMGSSDPAAGDGVCHSLGLAELGALVTRIAGSVGAAQTVLALRACLASLEGSAPTAHAPAAASGADVSDALARHVQPGTTLANFAMVCRAWAAAARALPIYYTPWDAEVQSVSLANKWPRSLNGALEWQLGSYLRRLPQLEPDLQVSMLMDPKYICVGYEAVLLAGVDLAVGGGPRRPHLYSTAIILSIPGAAYRRLARRSSVHRFSNMLYDAAREALMRFLQEILRPTLSFQGHCYRRTVTAPDAVYALQLHGRYCTNSVPEGIIGFFDRKQEAIEEDDLAQPLPDEQVLAYICTFGKLIAAILQEFMTNVKVSKAADVVLRRAAEDFLAQVFEMANKSTALETLTPTLQSTAFQASTRVIIDGMKLHRFGAGPPGWVLDDESIATWSAINAEVTWSGFNPAIMRRIEENNHGVHDTSDEVEDAEFVCTEATDSDDMDDDEHEAFLQADDDYNAGYEFAIDGEWGSQPTAFARWEAGRVDGEASRLHARKRSRKEKDLEDMCTGFSAAPNAALRAKMWGILYDGEDDSD
jgi:histone H3/H4